MITVKHLAREEWQVTVQAGVTTDHRVRLTQPVHERLAGDLSAEDLLRESFHFLLEREPNTAILPSFQLTVINHYFSDCEQEIRRRLSNQD